MNKSNPISRAQQQTSYTSPIASPFTKQLQYQQKAKILFDKLNNVRQVMEDNKYSQHQKLANQIGVLQQMLQNNASQKSSAFQKVLQHIGVIQTQIEEQKIQAQRNLLNLESKINSANRQCDRLFDKMTRERLESESRLLKAIDDRMEILLQRSKSLNSSPLYDESMIDKQPFLEQIQHLKSQVNTFYTKMQSEQQKIYNQFNNSMNRFKSFLNEQLEQGQSQSTPLMSCMKDLHIQVCQKIENLRSKRQQIQGNVINMLERIIQSFGKQKKI